MLTRWNPTERVLSFDTLNRMMEDFFGPTDETRSSFVPAVDVTETDKSFTFHCELPGIHKEDVEVELNGDRLTIKGRRERNREQKKHDYVNVERSYGSFMRSFRLDAQVKPNEIKAEFKDGVLTIEVPKAVEGTIVKKVPIA